MTSCIHWVRELSLQPALSAVALLASGFPTRRLGGLRVLLSVVFAYVDAFACGRAASDLARRDRSGGS
jgi:hypothetical protein